MKISCPACATHFSVPDSSIGPQGRKLRCARCGHKWHFVPEPDMPLTALPPEDEPEQFPDFAAMTRMAEIEEDSFAAAISAAERVAAAAPPPPAPPAEPPPPLPGGFRLDDNLSFNFSAPSESLDPSADRTDPPPFDLKELGFTAAAASAAAAAELDSDAPRRRQSDEDAARIADMMMSQDPAPIPDVFSAPPRQKRKRSGGWILGGLVSFMLLGSLSVGFYGFQDRLTDAFPVLIPAYEALGLQPQTPGKGLKFHGMTSTREAGPNGDVLIVYGMITNVTGHPRTVPKLHLELTDGQKILHQLDNDPPQATLPPHASVGFRISIDQPNPHASNMTVTFAGN